MAFNGSGTFNRTNGINSGSGAWAADRDAGTKIVAGRHDTHDQDLADGLSNCICKDGQTTITANIPFSNYSITGCDGIATANGRALALTATGSAAINFTTNSTQSWSISAASVLLPAADSTYDIGTTSVAVQSVYVDTVTAITGNDLQLSAIASQNVDVNPGGSLKWTFESDGDVIPAADGSYDIGSSSRVCANMWSRTLNSDTGNDLSLFAQTSQAINLYTGGSNRWVVDSSGNYVSQGAYDLDIGTGEYIHNEAVDASAGSAQGAATLTGQVSLVTGADGTKGIDLPESSVGAIHYIKNNETGNSLKIYPPSGDSINGGATNAAITLAGGEMAVIFKLTSSTWYGATMVNF